MLRTNDKNVKKEACEVFKHILSYQSSENRPKQERNSNDTEVLICCIYSVQSNYHSVHLDFQNNWKKLL